MRRKLSLALAAIMLATSICTVPALAQEGEMVIVDKLVGSFETEAERNNFGNAKDGDKPAGQAAFNPAYTQSTDVKATGESAVRATFADDIPDNMQHFQYRFGKDVDLENVEYVSMYIKNEGDLPVGFRFTAKTFIVTEENYTETYPETDHQFWKEHPGAFFEFPHDMNDKPAGMESIAVQVREKNSTEWTAASTAAVGDKNGAANQHVTLPAGFDGYVKIYLSRAERTISTNNIALVMAVGSADANSDLYFKKYAGQSLVFDDITLGVLTPKGAAPEAPSGLNGVAPSAADKADGKITGVTTAMEYRKDGETAYTACTGTEITGLAAGKYFVRVKAVDTAPAGADAEVVVPAYVSPVKNEYMNMINDFETAAKIEQVKSKEFLYLGGADFVKSSAKASGKQGAMITFAANPDNGVQKIVVDGTGNDLTKAEYVQFYINWTGSVPLALANVAVNAQHPTDSWMAEQAEKNPYWGQTEIDFWKQHADAIVGDDLIIGRQNAKVYYYADGEWKLLGKQEFAGISQTGDVYAIPAKFSGLIRVEIPEDCRKADRKGFALQIESKDAKVAGDFTIDDLALVTSEKDVEGYTMVFADYVKAEGGNNNPSTGSAMPLIPMALLVISGAALLVVKKSRKADR